MEVAGHCEVGSRTLGLLDFPQRLKPDMLSLISGVFPLAVLSSSKCASLVSSSKQFEPRLVISAKISPPPGSLPSPSDFVTVVDWSRVWELESLGLDLYP